jgi:hypothetical protein
VGLYQKSLSRRLRPPPPSALLAARLLLNANQKQPHSPARPPASPKRRLTSRLCLPARLAEASSPAQRSHGGRERVDVDPAQPGGGGRWPWGPAQVAAAAQLADNLYPQGPDLVPCVPFRSLRVMATLGWLDARMCCSFWALWPFDT